MTRHRDHRPPDAPQGPHHRAGRNLLPLGRTDSQTELEEETSASENGGSLPKRNRFVGITSLAGNRKASSASASFQDTTVLTEAPPAPG